MTVPEKRRICWPDPDATCLEGGCLYCDGHRPRLVSSIERWTKTAGTVRARYGNIRKPATDAFRWGRAHGSGPGQPV